MYREAGQQNTKHKNEKRGIRERKKEKDKNRRHK
jgi:hypothetical protein